MTDQHPITPPPELVEKWANHSASVHRENGTYKQHEFAIATQAARWGADQELEAMLAELKALHLPDDYVVAAKLRAARRPKPPSLKEQALERLELAKKYVDVEPIRRALEALDD